MKRKTIERLEIVLVKEKTKEYAPQISSSKDVFEIAKRAIWTNGMPIVEEFWALLLNTKNRLIGKSLISRGSIAECPVVPADVFRPVITFAASSLVIIHNHPSGDTKPSPEDRALTARLRRAGHLLGIRLLDHCIVGKTGYYSFRDDGQFNEDFKI